jgi:hypothetical protein
MIGHPHPNVPRQVVYARHRHSVMEFTSVTCIRTILTKRNFARFYASMNDTMMLDCFIDIAGASKLMIAAVEQQKTSFIFHYIHSHLHNRTICRTATLTVRQLLAVVCNNQLLTSAASQTFSLIGSTLPC